MPSDTHPYLLKEVFFLLLSPDIFKEFIQFQSWRLRVPGEKKKKNMEGKKRNSRFNHSQRTVDRNLQVGVTNLSLSEPLS